MIDEELERWTKDRATEIIRRIRLSKNPYALMEELEAVAVQIVIACADAGATDWPAELHLADVVEKHLMRAVVIPSEE